MIRVSVKSFVDITVEKQEVCDFSLYQIFEIKCFGIFGINPENFKISGFSGIWDCGFEIDAWCQTFLFYS